MDQSTDSSVEIIQKIERLRDLSDFCEHWPEIKAALSRDQLDSPSATQASRETIKWLVVLADKVCTVDPPEMHNA